MGRGSPSWFEYLAQLLNLLLRHYSFRNPEAYSIWGNE
jgi:hypothetical protein